MKSGKLYSGSMVECEDNWNCQVWKGVTIGTCFYSRQQRQGKGTSLGVGREHAMAMRAKAQAAGHGAAPGRGVVPPVRR
ncbi:small nuclear ribonucleoprotein SmD3a isoform X5 [Capsicum annuum]|uniref:small nuclear ribonucleoprotein SmD3a isoform X5 n=1 Tax=Capsicum annuum TaxID=4072 RepID=UPI0007BFAE45|nr:small nuclear ribonucleoprotein SmD3a isoform X5 [Capsicum annuum]